MTLRPASSAVGATVWEGAALVARDDLVEAAGDAAALEPVGEQLGALETEGVELLGALLLAADVVAALGLVDRRAAVRP